MKSLLRQQPRLVSKATALLTAFFAAHRIALGLAAPVPPSRLAFHASSSLALRGSHAAAGGVDAARVELELQGLSIASQSWARSSTNASYGANLVLARLPNGDELACLECDPDLFADWAESMLGGVWGARTESRRDSAPAGASKHPNSPQYEEWARKARPSALEAQAKVHAQDRRAENRRQNSYDVGRSAALEWLASKVGAERARRLNLTVSPLDNRQLAALRPRLQKMWSERKLVLGWGVDPFRQRMDFVAALVSLARSSPAFVPSDCNSTFGDAAPACGVLLSDGLVQAATEGQLRAALVQSLGPDILQQHAFDSAWNGTEQRRHLTALLVELKRGYRFYRQACLAHTATSRSCDRREGSEYVGRLACSPRDDLPASGCVYAELRRCSGACEASPGFFEYARYHGPLELLNTRASRDHIMGQCEEFSRAAYAMVSALGYEARYVLDFTDHVWIEVKVASLERAGASEWVHADPSEGVVGNPLMYEQGWGKKLTMIFAMTPWSVEHVTERYTAQYAEVQARRRVQEHQLRAIVDEVNERLQREVPSHSWGSGVASKTGLLSVDRSLEELALWAHFEGV